MTTPQNNAPAIGEALSLIECPIGLFINSFGDLCLKTEYGNNEGRIDAYIVSSGEFFWGEYPQTIANQRRQMVRPVDEDALVAALSLPDGPVDIHDIANPAGDGITNDLPEFKRAANWMRLRHQLGTAKAESDRLRAKLYDALTGEWFQNHVKALASVTSERDDARAKITALESRMAEMSGASITEEAQNG